MKYFHRLRMTARFDSYLIIQILFRANIFKRCDTIIIYFLPKIPNHAYDEDLFRFKYLRYIVLALPGRNVEII